MWKQYLILQCLILAVAAEVGEAGDVGVVVDAGDVGVVVDAGEPMNDTIEVEETSWVDCPAVEACTNGITEGYLVHISDPLDFVISETTLDAMCATLPTVVSCVAANKDSCAQHPVDRANSIIGVVSYLCNGVGRAFMVNLRNTPCYTDDSVSAEVNKMFKDCQDTFLEAANSFSGQDNMCSIIATLESCMEHGVDTMCGGEARAFVSDLWDLYMTVAIRRSMGCGAAVTRKRRSTIPGFLHFNN